VIPIADDSPKRYIPFVTYAIILVNCIVFYIQPGNPEALSVFFNRFGLIPSRLFQHPENPVLYLNVFSSMFVHADFMHLAGNMLYLWIFGDNIEYLVGHFRYVIFYLIVGIGAAVLQISIFPSTDVPMVGASGAISGILGAYLLKFPRNRVSILFFFIIIIRVVRVPALAVLSFWFLFQVFNGYFFAGEAGVAWYAHIGGFVTGFLLIKLFEVYPKYR
jgi:membrane associated rhomboid family serine protease